MKIEKNFKKIKMGLYLSTSRTELRTEDKINYEFEDLFLPAVLMSKNNFYNIKSLKTLKEYFLIILDIENPEKYVKFDLNLWANHYKNEYKLKYKVPGSSTFFISTGYFTKILNIMYKSRHRLKIETMNNPRDDYYNINFNLNQNCNINLNRIHEQTLNFLRDLEILKNQSQMGNFLEFNKYPDICKLIEKYKQLYFEPSKSKDPEEIIEEDIIRTKNTIDIFITKLNSLKIILENSISIEKIPMAIPCDGKIVNAYLVADN